MSAGTLSASDLRETLLKVAHAAADAARPMALQHFRQADLAADNKLDGGFDPVTEADRAAERAMRAVLAELRPDDAIFGEEYGQSPGTTGLTWVLDPIDGTRAYISGTPTWGMLIGVHDGTQVQVGVIDQPYTGERFVGAGAAQLVTAAGARPMQVRKTTSLADATIFTTFPEVGTEAEARAFHHLAKDCRLTRYGMDCYAYALLAMGTVDLVVEAGLNPYDIMGPIGVIEAAGGIVTTWDGGSALNGGRIIAAATPELHAAAMAKLAEVL